MNISLQSSPINVTDIDAAVGFYRDVLGLEITLDVSYEGNRWVTLGLAGQPGLGLVLFETDAGRSPEDGEALARLVAKGAMPPVILTTPDLDAVYRKVLDSGVDVLEEPTQKEWGPRDFGLRDPSGNMLRIAEAPAAA
ncbi:VOC family protein [Zhihengliuella alba]|uniref:VOC family protein n=1 Tax=Zhihengliuella alba TaxID=547018 RepID=A0ABP7DTU7_9MICC